MRPTLRQLEYIVAVAEAGRVGVAADRLNVSQPSLSAQLAEVEADLGTSLFLRGRGGAKPTPVGEEVVRRARMILHEVEDLRAVARGGGIFQGRLRLGVLPSIGPYLLPGVVRRLHAQHPDLRLVIREESTHDLEEGLRSGRLDMVISTPEDHMGARAMPLFTEALWAAFALDHPQAEGPEIALETLQNETLLTLGRKHRLSHIVEGLALRAGGRVSDEYEGTSLDAIRLMAASGAGVAVLPSIYAATEVQRGTNVALRRLSHPEAHRKIALMEPMRAEPTRGAAVLAAILQAEAEVILAGQAS